MVPRVTGPWQHTARMHGPDNWWEAPLFPGPPWPPSTPLTRLPSSLSLVRGVEGGNWGITGGYLMADIT